jgi:hypothetical protein
VPVWTRRGGSIRAILCFEFSEGISPTPIAVDSSVQYSYTEHESVYAFLKGVIYFVDKLSKLWHYHTADRVCDWMKDKQWTSSAILLSHIQRWDPIRDVIPRES